MKEMERNSKQIVKNRKRSWKRKVGKEKISTLISM
jgi:hypothetical protein